MDALVSQYSRPSYKEEGYAEQEQLELVDTLPPLSLKFALPPVPQVSVYYPESHTQLTSIRQQAGSGR